MVLTDRKMLARLIVIQGWSIRGLSRACNQGSHSYLVRLVRGDVKTCSAELAVAICANLEVPLDSLFLTKMSTDPQQPSGKPFRDGASGRPRSAAARDARRSTVAAVKSA